MLYKLTTLIITMCCPVFVYAQNYAQQIYKSQVLRDGFAAGQLVRNHTVLFYYHSDKKLSNENKLTDGIITVDRVVEYLVNETDNVYATHMYKDTLLTFYGITVKGKKNGTFLSIPPGNVFYINTYENNELNGQFRGYYTTGHLQCEGYYQDGKKIGEYREYFANGKLAINQQFVDAVNGLSHLTNYYTDGSMQSKGSCYQDKKVNEWYYYDKQGHLIKTEYYSNKGRLMKVK